MSVLDLLTGAWAIPEANLREIRAIYAAHVRGESADLSAIEARLGRPMQSEAPAHTLHAGGVALIEASGVLAPKANLMMAMSGGISAQMLASQIGAVAADPTTRSLVLALDSPGGNVIGIPEVAAALRAASSKIPTVVHSSEQLTSAGYWIGSAANAVYIAGPVVQVGSIGVLIAREFDPTSTKQQDFITAGKYKAIARSNEPLSTEARSVVQADVDYVYSLFVDDVAKHRGVSSAQVLDHMADGRVFRGQQAIDAGLVDGFSTLAELVDLMATQPEQFATRRQAKVTKRSGAPSSTGARAALGDTSSQPVKGLSMTTNALTRESLQADHAPLYEQLRASFTTEGAQAERDRILAVRATLVPGHETLVETLAMDGKTTPAEAALAVNAAVRAAHVSAASAHAADAPGAVAASAAPADAAPKSKAQQTLEAKAYAREHGVDFVAACKTLGFVS